VKLPNAILVQQAGRIGRSAAHSKVFSVLSRLSVAIVPIGVMVACGSAAAQSFVQAAANATTAATSFSVSFPSNTTAGNIILVGFDFASSVSFSSITDSQGNVFTEAGSQLTSPGGSRSRVYYAANIKGGADTVTINLSGSAGVEVYLTEYSGVSQVNPVDVQAGISGNAGSVSSGNATTTVAGDLIYGFCAADWTCSAGSGFNARSTLNNNLVEDMIAGNPGPYAATGSANNGWTMQMVALKAASVSTSSSSSNSPLNACDLNSDGVVNSADVQAAINMTLGLAQCTANIAGANVCNAEVVQRVVNASLGNGCLTSTGLHVVALSWTPSTSSGVTGYQISRGTSSTGPFGVLATVGNISSYTDTTVASGTTYFYTIAAMAGSTTGSNSTPVQAAVPTP
jgi:hypothetical protein